MRDVVGVNDGAVKGVSRVDVETALAERMLEGGLDRDDLVCARRAACETEQDLDLADGGVHQSRGGVVDRLVALDDLGVLARD